MKSDRNGPVKKPNGNIKNKKFCVLNVKGRFISKKIYKLALIDN